MSQRPEEDFKSGAVRGDQQFMVSGLGPIYTSNVQTSDMCFVFQEPREYKPGSKVQMEVEDPKTGRKTYKSFITRGEPQRNTATHTHFWEYQLNYEKDKVQHHYKGDKWFPEDGLERD